MAVFSTNQVRHFYVVSAGDKLTKNAKNQIYLQTTDALGTPIRSDLFSADKVLWATKTSSEKLAHKVKAYKVQLTDDPISGQDYILRITIKNYLGMSDEDLYFKYGAVHAVAGMTKEKFYQAMIKSLIKNFSREVAPLVAFYAGDDSTLANPFTESDVPDDLTAFYIAEVEQAWNLGTMPVNYVDFDVTPGTIINQGDEVVWGTATIDRTVTKTFNNGKMVADLEYFCLGERGDQYRNIGWPNVIPTKYKVDATKEYTLYDIHYCYTGPNEGPQKSEKTLTIAVPNDLTVTTTPSGAETKFLDTSGITYVEGVY